MEGRVFKIIGSVGRFTAIVLVALAMSLSLLLIGQRIFNPFHVVLSDSMSPQIQTGDAVILKDVDPAAVGLGEVVIFHDPNKKEDLVIHRVVGLEVRNNVTFFTTKGDNNETKDDWEISMGEVVGGVAMTLPKFGRFLDFISQPRGYAALIVIPAISSLLLGLLLGLMEKASGTRPGGRDPHPAPHALPPC